MRMNFYMVGVTIDKHEPEPEVPRDWLRAAYTHAYLRQYTGGPRDKIRVPCDVISMSFGEEDNAELDIQMASVGPYGDIKPNPNGKHMTLVWDKEKCWWESQYNTGWVLCWKEGYQHVPY